MASPARRLERHYFIREDQKPTAFGGAAQVTATSFGLAVQKVQSPTRKDLLVRCRYLTDSNLVAPE